MKLRMRKKGQSVVEFTAVVILILGAFLLLQKYIVRGFSGRWKGIGDSLGQGRIYDPKKTVACAYDPTLGVWFEKNCYKTTCEDGCFPVRGAGCDACINFCRGDYCNQ